jgi:hypothetical protein
MRILVISSRYPSPEARGDQSILFSHLQYLGKRHEVSVVTPNRAPSPHVAATVAELAQVKIVDVGRGTRALSAVGAMLRGQPAQVGWMMPSRTWRQAKAAARCADVALIMTSRSIRSALPAATVLNHVDALSFNMARRARGPEPLPIRLFARYEAWRMRAWELRLAGHLAAQVGTSIEVADMLPQTPRAHVIPPSYPHAIHDDPPGHERDIDLILTGDMSYPPNREAANLLLERILPRILSQRPQTSVWVVGRSATWITSKDVTTASDVPDLLSFLRRAKVAIAPVSGGSQLKTLEAAANGAALVAKRWTADCYGLPAAAAEDPVDFAREVLRLLEDDAARQEQADAARRVARTLTNESCGARLEAILLDAASQARPSHDTALAGEQEVIRFDQVRLRSPRSMRSTAGPPLSSSQPADRTSARAPDC